MRVRERVAKRVRECGVLCVRCVLTRGRGARHQQRSGAAAAIAVREPGGRPGGDGDARAQASGDARVRYAMRAMRALRAVVGVVPSIISDAVQRQR